MTWEYDSLWVVEDGVGEAGNFVCLELSPVFDL